MKKKLGSLIALGVALILVVLFFPKCAPAEAPYEDFSSEDINNDDLQYIGAFHAAYFPSSVAEQPKDNPAVYVDFSNGITEYSLSNVNNKEVFKMLFKSVESLFISPKIFILIPC